MRKLLVTGGALVLAASVAVSGLVDVSSRPVASSGRSEFGAEKTFALAGGPVQMTKALAATRGPGMKPFPLSDEELTAVVRRTCVACHNDQLMTASFSLQGYDVGASGAPEQLEATEKIIGKLRLGMMPPPGIPRPGGDTLQVLVETLEESADRAATTNPGVRRFQRLTRAEYERVVKTLLDLDVDASNWLPGDMGDFDTWSDDQGLSMTVVEAFMRAGTEVSRLAVGNRNAPVGERSYPVPLEVSQHAWDRLEGAPFGTRGGTVVLHNFPADGEYVFSLRTQFGEEARFEDIDLSIDGENIALLELENSGGESGPIESEPIFVRAGQRSVSAAFVRLIDGPYEDRFSSHEWSVPGGERSGQGAGITTLSHLRELTISGPFRTVGLSDTPSRQRVFSCQPNSAAEELPCATAIIERLASEAYRRLATDEDLRGLISIYESARAEGDFEGGIRTTLQAILSHPSFIFRLEREPSGLGQGENYVLNGLDLASRLSFFLWGTVPDGELIRIAEDGRLTDPEVLEGQAKRMLRDPRSEALATRFAAQWLRLGEVARAQPDPFFFPDFNRQLSDAMRRETELLFHHLIREDRSFLELLTADYTFVNARLARHYGIPHSGGVEFDMVSMVDPNRRGLLSHGSILTLTSLADRTSPVRRGEWVMETLLDSPPPPPPPNVPLLDETDGSADGRFLTTRERMEIHRANPTCNSCHQYIDPIGLSLDNFDAVGSWRIRENQMPLDTRGTFYDGTQIGSPLELADALLRRPTPLARTFTKNLLAYAIGRRTTFFDQPSIRMIARQAEENDYRMSTFILGVVQSDAFRMRQVEVTAEDRE